jgi:hypothetical protein
MDRLIQLIESVTRRWSRSGMKCCTNGRDEGNKQKVATYGSFEEKDGDGLAVWRSMLDMEEIAA